MGQQNLLRKTSTHANFYAPFLKEIKLKIHETENETLTYAYREFSKGGGKFWGGVKAWNIWAFTRNAEIDLKTEIGENDEQKQHLARARHGARRGRTSYSKLSQATTFKMRKFRVIPTWHGDGTVHSKLWVF